MCLNTSRLDELKELDEDGSDSVLKEVIGLYLGSMPLKLNQLREALDKENFSEARQTAHNIRSSSVNIGAECIGDIMRDIEYADESLKVGPVFREKFTRALREFDLVKDRLQYYL